jgi:NTP pyrophosphatase (non-canonical NTP hydrolase)
MEIKDLSARAMTIRQQYAKLEQARYGRSWTREEVAIGFVGDVGDLMKLVMAAGGVRDIPGAKEKLGHELADCLWCVLVLSEMYGIDIESEFARVMDEIEHGINQMSDS